MSLPDPIVIAFAVMALAVLPLAVYSLMGGELVGEMRCPWLQSVGARTVRVRVQRFVRKGGVIPRVQVQARVMGVAPAWSFAPAEALALAKLLEDAAAEAEAR